MLVDDYENNYVLGRGELYFAQYLPGTRTPGGERYLGNTPEFNATIETENLDHYNSDRGINEKDASIPLQVNRTASFITDNIHVNNIQLFFYGSSEVLTDAGGAVTGEVISGVQPGMIYQIGMSETNPVGVRAISSTGFTASQGGSELTAGEDYEIDFDQARLKILEGGAVTPDGDISLDYTTLASTRTRVISGRTPIEGALRFISRNPVGSQPVWYMPWVKLRPNGDYALKGDEWQQIPFNVEILRKAGVEAIYVDGQPKINA
ncbi:hypothetical protein [Amorphus orientalis]|uniref:Uncharacterized protein n=1 Tax=Amorphus orientalis TaxID=649198 RepID=A0AAE3VT81_9HYPH|nr:hypothetical protein [Amorphus orientalis]MDQ0317723.1 hypothetical protein [Amorphus orientalis]